MKYCIVFFSLFCATTLYAAENIPQIKVFGMAEQYVVPDEMHWDIQTKTIGSSIDTVAQQHLDTVNRVLHCLGSHNIAEKKITTSQMKLQEKWEYRKDERVQDGYIATTIISFISKNMEEYIPLWKDISTLGGIEISNVNFALSNIEHIREQLKTQALQNAYKKAGKLAAVLNMQVGTPLLIEDGQTPVYNGFREEMANSAMMMTKSTPGSAVSAGQRLIRTSILVVFQLKKY